MNKLEEIAKVYLEKQGYKVYRNGWPDFLVTDSSGKKGFCIEVKSKSDNLSTEQKNIHRFLQLLGVPTYTFKENADDATKFKGRRFITRVVCESLKERVKNVENKIYGVKHELECCLCDYNLMLRETNDLIAEIDSADCLLIDINSQDKLILPISNQKDQECPPTPSKTI